MRGNEGRGIPAHLDEDSLADQHPAVDIQGHPMLAETLLDMDKTAGIYLAVD